MEQQQKKKYWSLQQQQQTPALASACVRGLWDKCNLSLKEFQKKLLVINSGEK